MNQIITVENVHGYVDATGTVWLNAEDIARGLGFTQTKNGVEYVRWGIVNSYLQSFGFSQQAGNLTADGYFIPENMFYRLAMKASNAAAQKFQATVADKILPSIRRTGSYISPQADFDPTKIINANFLRRIADELEARDKKIAELTPKANYCDNVLKCDDGISVTIIAKDYGMSAQAFNQLLQVYKIQHRVGNVWVINQPYAGLGYARSETMTLGNGVTKVRTLWTQRGRAFLYNELKRHEILPVAEREEIMEALI